VHEESIGHVHQQTPLSGRHPSGREQALRGQQLRSPPLGGEEKCVACKTEPWGAGNGVLEFGREMEIVTFVGAPRLRKRKESVALVYQRALLRDRRAVPRGLRGGQAEAAASGEAEFEGGKRLIAGVAQPVV